MCSQSSPSEEYREGACREQQRGGNQIHISSWGLCPQHHLQLHHTGVCNKALVDVWHSGEDYQEGRNEPASGAVDLSVPYYIQRCILDQSYRVEGIDGRLVPWGVQSGVQYISKAETGHAVKNENFETILLTYGMALKLYICNLTVCWDMCVYFLWHYLCDYTNCVCNFTA